MITPPFYLNGKRTSQATVTGNSPVCPERNLNPLACQLVVWFCVAWRQVEQLGWTDEPSHLWTVPIITCHCCACLVHRQLVIWNLFKILVRQAAQCGWVRRLDVPLIIIDPGPDIGLIIVCMDILLNRQSKQMNSWCFFYFWGDKMVLFDYCFSAFGF